MIGFSNHHNTWQWTTIMWFTHSWYLWYIGYHRSHWPRIQNKRQKEIFEHWFSSIKRKRNFPNKTQVIFETKSKSFHFNAIWIYSPAFVWLFFTISNRLAFAFILIYPFWARELQNGKCILRAKFFDNLCSSYFVCFCILLLFLCMKRDSFLFGKFAHMKYAKQSCDTAKKSECGLIVLKLLWWFYEEKLNL